MKELNGAALVIAIIFLVILPPVSVFIKREDLDTSFWINVILCFCGWVPAILHGIYVLFFKED